jgi:hypothetical protein
MSWPVENLLLNKYRIELIDDLESDELNDYIIVSKKYEELLANGLISTSEKRVLETLIETQSLNLTSSALGLNRVTVAKTFKAVCDRIGYSLGGSFTDEGFCDYMAEKYKLPPEKVEIMERFIRSKYRMKTMTNVYEQ